MRQPNNMYSLTGAGYLKASPITSGAGQPSGCFENKVAVVIGRRIWNRRIMPWLIPWRDSSKAAQGAAAHWFTTSIPEPKLLDGPGTDILPGGLLNAAGIPGGPDGLGAGEGGGEIHGG